MKKRILAMLLAGTMVFGLAACGGGDDKKPEASNPPAAAGVAKEDLKVGFVHIGDEGDMGYTYNMVLGVKEMQKNLGLSDDQIITKYNVTEDEKCADALNELVDAGCQIVFATSFGFGDYVTAAARENPEVQFCHATGFQAHEAGLDNLHNCFASIYEGRYLAGIAAGMKAKEMGNPKLGYVGAYPFAEVISGYTAFYLGAKSVYPDVTMDVIYTNTWNDANLESQTAEALINRGCGVVSQHSDSTGPATMAEKMGKFQVGYNADMISAAPGASLISTRIDWGIYFTEAVQAVLDGTEIPMDWSKGYADGAVLMTALNEDIAAEGTKEAIEAAEAGIKDGSQQVFAGPLKGVNSNGDTLELAEGESFAESDVAGGKTSAPYFDYIVEGVTVVSDQ
ncbi:BMP family ABC transporter substrate-binding protein [Pseudoflavonifractor sp. HCP28S3_F10]|uniref:BMP family ABC transporter substrate-binding protein n=1 Tax=Pseudoflavonifractor sp. HCP28S3_F10 TaxID=3438947 RepID=UPI003F8CC1E8